MTGQFSGCVGPWRSDGAGLRLQRSPKALQGQPGHCGPLAAAVSCVGPPFAHAIGDVGGARQPSCGRRLVAGAVRQAGRGHSHIVGAVSVLPRCTGCRQNMATACRAGPGVPLPSQSGAVVAPPRTVMGCKRRGSAGRAVPGRGQCELPVRPSPFCPGRSERRGGESAGKLSSRAVGMAREKGRVWVRAVRSVSSLVKTDLGASLRFTGAPLKPSHLRLVSYSSKNGYLNRLLNAFLSQPK